MRRFATLGQMLTILLGVGLLSGCSGEATPPVSAQEEGDWAESIIGCLAESGWEAREMPDGGLLADVPAGRGDIYESDFADCESRYGFDQPPAVLSAPEARALYAEVSATADCLSGRGFNVDQQPTEEVFVDAVTSGAGGWDPYSDVYVPGQMDESEYFAILQECPRTW